MFPNSVSVCPGISKRTELNEHTNSVEPVPGIQSSPPHITAVFKKLTSNSSLSLGHRPKQAIPASASYFLPEEVGAQTSTAGCTFSAQFIKIIPATVLLC